MSFLSDFEVLKLISAPQIIFLNFFDLQVSHEGHNMISRSVIVIFCTSGQIVK